MTHPFPVLIHFLISLTQTKLWENEPEQETGMLTSEHLGLQLCTETILNQGAGDQSVQSNPLDLSVKGKYGRYS